MKSCKTRNWDADSAWVGQVERKDGTRLIQMTIAVYPSDWLVLHKKVGILCYGQHDVARLGWQVGFFLL